MIELHFLEDTLFQLGKLKSQADKAVAQVDDEHLFALIDPDANSIALIMKHLAGNMRSRWTDFLTTDGEKPDRERDTEFERSSDDTRESIGARWEDGWHRVLSAISSLRPEDLERTVVIRGEPHTVLQAINRQVSHYSAHVGQIVLLAKHFTGPRWQTLSIPKRVERRHMKAVIGTLLTVLVLSTVAASAAPPSDPRAEKEVIAAMEMWRQAMMKKDGAALAKLYHEDLSYGHSSGLVEDKPAAVNHIVTTKADYAAVDLLDTKVKIHGNVALVNGRVNYKQVTDGKATDVKLHVLHVWVRTPQGWQMIGRQSTREGSQ